MVGCKVVDSLFFMNSNFSEFINLKFCKHLGKGMILSTFLVHTWKTRQTETTCNIVFIFSCLMLSVLR